MPFDYTPLDASAAEIRVVDILPARFGDEIRCTLRHVSMHNNPLFYALSYTWGDPAVTLPIQLCHRAAENHGTASPSGEFHEFQVTSNLEAALRHLRSGKETLTIWIDAVCINQQDLRERAAEVQRMRLIYTSAAQVYVWIGKSREPSDLWYNVSKEKDIRAAFRYMAWVSKKLVDFGHEDELDRSDLGHLKPYRPPWRRLATRIRGVQELRGDSMLMPSGPAWRGLYTITKRPWWTRRWVLQEVVLTTRPIELVCGLEKFDFRLLVVIVAVLYGNVAWNDRRTMTGASNVMDLRLVQKLLGIADHNTPLSVKIVRILSIAAYFECTEPRDVLYAVLGLLGDVADVAELRPDYERPLATFFIDIATFVMQSSKSLGILCHWDPNHAAALLPSWVPTWNRKGNLQPNLKEASFHFSPCGRILVANGLALGACPEPFGALSMDEAREPLHVQNWVLSVEKSLCAHATVSTRYGGDQKARAAFRTALFKYIYIWADPVSFQRSLSALLEAVDGDLQNDSTHKQFLLRVGAIGNCSFGVSLKGYFGFLRTDGDLAKDDEIFLFPGCIHACIMRKEADGHRIVGLLESIEFESMCLELEKFGELEEISIV